MRNFPKIQRIAYEDGLRIKANHATFEAYLNGRATYVAQYFQVKQSAF